MAVEARKSGGGSSGKADVPTAVQPAVFIPRRPDDEDQQGNEVFPGASMASVGIPTPQDISPMDITPQLGGDTSPAPAQATASGETAQEKSKENSWSAVVKKGRKRSVKTQEGKSRNTRKMPGITGTAVINNDELSTVRTKLVSVFATKFNLNLEADTLRLFLEKQMSREVKCKKIDIPHSRFSSLEVGLLVGWRSYGM